jgi:hypothetical protein
MEVVEQKPAVTERVMGVFNSWKDYYIGKEDKSEEDAKRYALNQTLNGLDDAQVQSGDLSLETSAQVARALIKVSEPRLREIIKVFEKEGDPVEQLDYSDPRAVRIITAARKILGSA